MHELGLLKLSRVEAPFVSLTSPASGPAFVSDKLDIIPDSTLFARLRRLPPSDFYEHTRLTVTEFLILYQELQPLIIRPRHADLEGEYSQEQRARFSHRKLHPADEMLLWLYHADGNRHTVLCLLLDIDRTSITVITDHVTRCMNEAWKDEVRWPSREDREELHGLFSCHPKAVAAIDGTHCRIDVPDSHDREDTCYSAYKKYHTQNYLVCCDAFGFVVYIGGPFDGRFNDRECFLASSFCDGDARMLSSLLRCSISVLRCLLSSSSFLALYSAVASSRLRSASSRLRSASSRLPIASSSCCSIRSCRAAAIIMLCA